MAHDEESLVTIATFETELEASFARGALHAIGIPAQVPGDWSGSLSGPFRGGSHLAELQVFESDRARAIVELRRLHIHIAPPQRRA